MHIKRPLSKQPIPDHAKRVFKGHMFDTYQWEQELFDGQKTTFEKIKRTDTVSVIPITADGKIMLSEQEQPGTKPFIGSLGGKMDPEETPLDAAKRELLEETGYTANEFILWHAIQPHDKIDWAIYIFIAKGCKKVAKQNVDAGEKIKLKFVTFDEFIKLSAQENFRDTETALKLFRLSHNPKQLEETKQLFKS
jgi:8-oxo-dGTP pyrophosphatase MutT (NUDIX family)